MKTNLNLNEYIDHTLLKPDARLIQIEQLCQEAKTYLFKTVCVNPYYVATAFSKLKDSSVKVCTVIGFPLGANTTKTKVFETINAIENGATEIDVVINIAALKDNNKIAVLKDLVAIREVCIKNNENLILKVIIECSLLTTEEIIFACELVTQAKADFIKTSTGFANGGAKIEDIMLMKEHIGKNVQIKASGGIRTQEQALELIAAGATRIGTSNGINIINNSESKNDY